MSPLTYARLYINDQEVGTVQVRGSSDSWAYGDFQPNGAFSQFAPLFAHWARVMHADDNQNRLSHHAAEELQQIESDLDTLQTHLLLPDRQDPIRLSQVNIDGLLIEWKTLERGPTLM